MSHNQEDEYDDLAVQQESDDNVEHGTAREGFPLVLYAMLEQMDAKGLAHIVSWQPHGRCFIVKKRRSFVEQVVPRYFRMSKFASFQRQLNLYGFRRITKGQDKDGYYHENFIRNRRDLCERIYRLQFNGKKPKRNPDNIDPEPNFYSAEVLIGSDDAGFLKQPYDGPANSTFSIPNTSTLPSGFAATSSHDSSVMTAASIHPSLFMASSSASLNISVTQLQQFLMNNPSLFMPSQSSLSSGSLQQHLHQDMMNHGSVSVAASASIHGVLPRQQQVMINAPTSLANLNMAAWASSLQTLGSNRPQQQHGSMVPQATMFPSVRQPRSTTPQPQSILQQLSATAHSNATFQLYGYGDRGADGHGSETSAPFNNPAANTFVNCTERPANGPTNNLTTRELREFSSGTLAIMNLSSQQGQQHQEPPRDPPNDSRSFDAYLAALEFENGDPLTTTQGGDTGDNSREHDEAVTRAGNTSVVDQPRND